MPLVELGALDRGGEGRAGEHLETAAELDQLDAMPVEVVVLAQLVERGAHVVEGGVGVESDQLFDRHRARRGEQRGFKQLRKRVHGAPPAARRPRVEA